MNEWRQRADSGDGQYAIALGLMAIAEAITAHGTKEVEAIHAMARSERPDALDAKFDTLIAMVEQKFDAPQDDPPPNSRWWRRT